MAFVFLVACLILGSIICFLLVTPLLRLFFKLMDEGKIRNPRD